MCMNVNKITYKFIHKNSRINNMYDVCKAVNACMVKDKVSALNIAAFRTWSD